MSITYSTDVASYGLLSFLKILFKWRGSVYKCVWVEGLVIFLLHLGISLTVNLLILPNADQKINELMEMLIDMCKEVMVLIPIKFVLGFYVMTVVVRWFSQQNTIPWPDALAVLVSVFISGNSEEAVVIRRTIMRYINTSFIIAAQFYFKDIRTLIRDEADFIKAGYLNEDEMERMKEAGFHFFIPLNWSLNLVHQAREAKLIDNDVTFDRLIDEIGNFRTAVATFFVIDYINPPLVYTQTVGLTLYAYIFTSLISVQEIHLETDDLLVTTILPHVELLIDIIYIAWYKVAENLMNPFGKTDYTFDLIYIIQRNLQVGYLFVDHLHGYSPPILKEPPEGQVIDSSFAYQGRDDEEDISISSQETHTTLDKD